MKIKLPIFIIVSFLIAIFFVFNSSNIFAQNALNLQVSPPIIEITLDPGDTYSDFIKFENLNTTESLTLYPQKFSFVARGDEGGQEFLDDSEETTTFSLAQWISLSSNEITLKPLERIVLPFTITVPLDAEPGGRYGAILLANQPEVAELGSNVGIGTQTGSIILLRVSGDVVESAILTSFKTGKDTYDYPPVDFEIDLRNTGNVHVKPKGTIEITNILGNSVGEVVVNESQGNVLPESNRKFTPSWERDEFTIGKFTAVLNLQYGEDTPMVLTETVSFWVLPIKEIVIAFVLIVIVIILFFVLVKTYNRMVLKKALKMQEELRAQNQAQTQPQTQAPTL